MQDEAPPIWKSFLSDMYGSLVLIPIFALWCGQITARRIRDWDAELSDWCHRPEQRKAWILFSRMGDGWLYALVYFLARFSGETATAHRIAASCFLAWGLGSALKVLFRRTRRRECRLCAQGIRTKHKFIAKLSSWSFPSQHAAVSVAFAAALWPNPFAALLAVAICSSRVLVGAHYLGDVLAGVVIGVVAGRLA